MGTFSHSPVIGLGSRVSELRGRESPQEWDFQEVGDGGSGDGRGRVELEPQRVSNTGWGLGSSAEVGRMGGGQYDTVLYVQIAIPHLGVQGVKLN